MDAYELNKHVLIVEKGENFLPFLDDDADIAVLLDIINKSRQLVESYNKEKREAYLSTPRERGKFNAYLKKIIINRCFSKEQKTILALRSYDLCPYKSERIDFTHTKPCYANPCVACNKHEEDWCNGGLILKQKGLEKPSRYDVNPIVEATKFSPELSDAYIIASKKENSVLLAAIMETISTMVVSEFLQANRLWMESFMLNLEKVNDCVNEWRAWVVESNIKNNRVYPLRETIND